MWKSWMGVFCGSLACIGCVSSPSVVPEGLEPSLDQTVSFSQLLENPERYKQKVVMLGGRILSAKRLSEATRLEVLQLPLYDGQQPTDTLTESLGRFIAMEPTFLDPAKLPPQTRVTIVGEVTGSTQDKVGETNYRFPVLVIKHLHVWESGVLGHNPNVGPSIGIFGGGGSGGRAGGGVGIGIGF